MFNVVFFAAASAIVVRGYMCGDERYINFVHLLVALGVLTRYVDVFWSLLAGSAFFIIGGLLLFGVVLGLERPRRTLVTRMDLSAGSAAPLVSASVLDVGGAQ